MRDLLHELERPNLYDQYFGMPLTPALLDARPWKLLNQLESGVAVVNDKDNFKVSLDVQQFKPEELSVKVVDNFVVVEGKHEERRDNHGFVSRHFTRRYRLPDDCDTSALQTTLSSDGVLQLHAPKKLQEKNARHVPITQTNAPAVKAAEPGHQEQHKEEKKK